MKKAGFHVIVVSGLAASALSACAGNADQYPSLALRDAERVKGQFSPSPPDNTAPTYSVSSARIEDALAHARASHRQFMGSEPKVANLALNAKGRDIGDNSHSRALIAVADLTALRSETVSALADLDRLEAQGKTLFAPTEAVKSAQAEVARLIDVQNTALNALTRELQR